ncbi:hypothetical protein H2200_001856 [Cladophialophora chaetospira]|uniref:Uncharacterized protein n=1 Tax=Cladophialophora chaetospira TaxID=386627 RepID=A0AA38XLN7_9EURO|nr:hypothetical protein H2200_001856 [Cladophialophora chaetospira]
MSPSLPPQLRLPPQPLGQNVRRPGQVLPTPRVARNIRPLVYAIGIAGIVASGAWIGAYLKTGQQQDAARTQAQRLVAQLEVQPIPQQTEVAVPPTYNLPGDTEYNQRIQTLESKRSQLLAQKTGLETKLRDFHDSQRRKAEEEKERKEFGLKR